MFYALLILGFSSSVMGKHFILEPGECPDIEVMENFNISKAQGKWYYTLHSVLSAWGNEKCSTDDLSVDEDGTVKVIFTTIKRDNGVMTSVPATWRAPDSDEPAKFKVADAYATHESDLFVLDTDYESYFLSYRCENEEDHHIVRAWFQTRNPYPSKSVMAKFDEFVEKYNFRKASFERIKQADCTLRAPELITKM